MNEEYRNRILRNVNFLAQNTSNLPVLLNLLLGKNILHEIEIQAVNSESIGYDKYTRLYHTLIKKSDDAFPKVLQCLHESNNSTIAEKLNQDSRSADRKQLIWFDMSSPTRIYKGRNEDLERIHDCFLKSQEDDMLTFVGITGLGGIGKSELAKNYGYKFFREVQGHCIWLNAETGVTISDSFRRLATIPQMKIPLTDEQGVEKSAEILSVDICERLSNEKYLLIFDNVDNYTDFFQSFVIYATQLAPYKIKPFVLMTSRFQLVYENFGELATQIELKVLSQDSAVSFFKEALKIPEDRQDVFDNIKLLCQTLDCLPLAMQQAVAYINSKLRKSDVATEVKEYLKLFDVETIKFLNHQLPRLQYPNDFSKTTYVTWQITLKKLRSISGVGSKADQVLDVVSFFHSDKIDISFIKKIIERLFNNEQEDFEEIPQKRNEIDIFELLDIHSLCQCSDLRKNGANMSLHRLVQDTIRVKLDEENKISSVLTDLLLSIDTIFVEDAISLNEMIHIRTLLRHATKNENVTKYNEHYTNLFDKVARKYYDDGRFRDAHEFNCEAIAQLSASHGPENQHTLKMMCWKGGNMLQLADQKGALELLKNVYTTQKNVLKEDHDDTLRTAATLGIVYHKRGKYEDALNLLTDTLQKREKFPSEANRKEALGIQDDIANTLKALGKYEESLALGKKTWANKIIVFGEKHLSTLTTKLNLANTHQRLKHYDEALQLSQEVLEERKKVLGDKHPKTLNAQHNIAKLFELQGKYEESRKKYEEILEVQESLLGKENSSTLNTQQNIGNIYARTQMYEEAIQIYEEVLEVRERVFEKEHPNTLRCKHNIAFVYKSQAKYEEALNIYKEVLEARERVLPILHPKIAETKTHIQTIMNEILKNSNENAEN